MERDNRIPHRMFEDYQSLKDITKRETHVTVVHKNMGRETGHKTHNLPVDWDFGSFSNNSHDTIL